MATSFDSQLLRAHSKTAEEAFCGANQATRSITHSAGTSLTGLEIDQAGLTFLKEVTNQAFSRCLTGPWKLYSRVLQNWLLRDWKRLRTKKSLRQADISPISAQQSRANDT